MNLFRSEEHARNWALFDPAHERHLRPLSEWVDLFSQEHHRARTRADYMSWREAHDEQVQAYIERRG